MVRAFIILLFFSACKNDAGQPDSVLPDSTTISAKGDLSDSVLSRQLERRDLPDSISFKGKFVQAFSYNDKNGESIIVFSTVNEYPSPKVEMNEDEISSELHVSRYKINEGSISRDWKWEGGVMNCPFDITSQFITDATTITDLNNNGIAEICYQVMESCRSDVSSSGKRLVMLEGKSIYTLKGSMWLAQSPEQVMDITAENVNLKTQTIPKDEWEAISFRDGRYENDDSFEKAPKEFLNHARSQWLRFVKESFD